MGLNAIHLGLDVGGSTTRAVLVDATGALLGEGRAGPSSPRLVGIERARAAWHAALEAAWTSAGRATEPVAGIGAGFAGARGADEQGLLAEWLAAALAPGAPVLVDHDLGIAHRGAFGGTSGATFTSAAGVVVVAGTGSAAFARSDAGDEALVGGYGPFADDAGSGFDLGRGAIAACLRALDGRGAATRLLVACLEALRYSDQDELVEHARTGRIPRTAVAGLARRVLVEVREGDRVAAQLLERAVDELALAAEAAARRVGLAAPRVAGVGGLFRDATFAHGFARALAVRLPAATPTRPALEPAHGAAHWSVAGFKGGRSNIRGDSPYPT